MSQDLELRQEYKLPRKPPSLQIPSNDHFQEGGDPKEEENRVATEEVLHTGRGGYVDDNLDAGPRMSVVAGKPRRGFCREYGKFICLFVCLLVIVSIGAGVFVFLVLGYGVDLINPAGPVAVDNQCPEPYILKGDQCEPCETTRLKGYIKQSKSCDECINGKIYDPQLKACIECPCGGDCSATEKEIVRGGQCVQCPNWKKNTGDNKCSDRCAIDERWDGSGCVKNFKNRCRHTQGYRLFKEGTGPRVFDEMCERRCSQVDIHMHMDKEVPEEDLNPYFPRGIRCRNGDDEGDFHGQNDMKYSTVTVGAADACIYRIERQGPSAKQITAVKYSWFVGEKYESSTFGNYKVGDETVYESFNGCLFGMVGHFDKDEDKIQEIDFQYKYDDFYRCAVDQSFKNQCKCYGKVHYGLYGNPSDDSVLTFHEMKSFNPQFVTKENVNGEIECNSKTFGVDPYAGHIKQCFCERPKWWLN